jgi:hypothetical protein
VAQQQHISIRLANGSVGPLAELYEPIIGPTTVALDRRTLEVSPEKTASDLAHELRHVVQRGRRWPGVAGTLILDLRANDILDSEREVAPLEAKVDNLPSRTPPPATPTDQDWKAFYPEGQYGAAEMIFRRLASAALLVAAYLFWPKLKGNVAVSRSQQSSNRERTPMAR